MSDRYHSPCQAGSQPISGRCTNIDIYNTQKIYIINRNQYNIIERNCTKGTLMSSITVNIASDSTGYRIIALTL